MIAVMAIWQAFFFSLPGLVFVAFYGAATGSFLNVVAWRLPRGISTVAPRSRCPRCANAIRPWHNVPVLGWLLLSGRCRDCFGRIPARYPLIEASMAAIFVLVFLNSSSLGTAVLGCLVASWALVLALIDLDLHVLPDSLTLPAIPLALLAHGLPGPGSRPPFSISLQEALAASGGSFVALTLLAAAWRHFRREEGLAEGLAVGDIRFTAALGAIFGPEQLLLILVTAAMLAFPLAFLLRNRQRGTAQPFGTSLGLATLLLLIGWIPTGGWP